MAEPTFWSRLRKARFFRVLAIYLGASWLVVQVVGELRIAFELPTWISSVTIILLTVGLLVLLATAWVQAHPLIEQREAAQEVPESWEVDLGGLARSVSRGRLPHLTWGRALVGGLLAFGLVFGMAGLWVVIQDRGRSFLPGEAVADAAAAPAIAVLPFEAKGEGLEVWREGVVDLVTTNIDGAAGLRGIDSRTVLARWREAVGEGTPDLATSLEVARRTGARYAVVGSAVALGPNLRLTADVYEVEGGRSLGSAQAEGAPDDVYALVDQLSIGILGAILRESREDVPRVDLARATTTSLPALKAYLEGEVHYRHSDFAAAIPAYQRAVEIDSTFALAFYRLSLSYGWGETLSVPLQLEYAERAVRFVDRLPERDAILVRGKLDFERGNLEGMQEFQKAVPRYPDDAEMWYLLGEIDTHHGRFLLQSDGTDSEAYARAIALDPRFAPPYIHAIENALTTADSATADSLITAFEDLTREDDRFARNRRATYNLAWGSSEARRAALDFHFKEDRLPLYRAAYHPRFLPVAEAVIDRRAKEGEDFPHLLERIGIKASRGKLDEAVTAAESAPGAAPPIMLFLLSGMGLPVPDDQLAAAVDSAPSEEDTPFAWYELFLGLIEADRASRTGRWEDHARAVARIERAAAAPGTEADSTWARRVSGFVEAARGLEAWRRGRVDEAADRLEEARRQLILDPLAGPFGPLVLTIHRWLAEIHLERGDPEAALPYAETFGVGDIPTWAVLRAEVYERLGRRDDAKRHYEFFLASFVEADPELQPLVARARQGIARLGMRPRG